MFSVYPLNFTSCYIYVLLIFVIYMLQLFCFILVVVSCSSYSPPRRSSWFSFVYFLNASSSSRWQLVDYISRFCAGHLLYNYVYFEPHCFISIFYSLLHFSSLYFFVYNLYNISLAFGCVFFLFCFSFCWFLILARWYTKHATKLC